ncbi:hypothetical protein MMC28_011556 [Mycoblastus sanguinarius]|nr:hypothetical protein [Mycoblastus sanguinarius]
MNVEDNVIPSNVPSSSSSSHFSDDSYIDPPLPEPCDAFSGDNCTPGTFKPHRNEAQMQKAVARCLSDGEIDTHGFLDSDEGSDVDAEALPLKAGTLRTARAVGRSPTPAQRLPSESQMSRVQAETASGKPERIAGSELESNIVNAGRRSAKPHTQLFLSIPPLHSSKSLHYSKLRSGKRPPEPIFVVRSRILSKVKGTDEAKTVLPKNGASVDSLMDGYRGQNTSQRRLAQTKSAKKGKSEGYKPPSVSDDVENEQQYDPDL